MEIKWRQGSPVFRGTGPENSISPKFRKFLTFPPTPQGQLSKWTTAHLLAKHTAYQRPRGRYLLFYISDPQIEWKINFCCYLYDISGFSLLSSSCWRGNMKYYLRKALITIIWLLCSFQVAQLWLDPTIIARSSVMELALISIVMVVIAAAFHWGTTRAIKFWHGLQRIHSLNLIHNLRSHICQA